MSDFNNYDENTEQDLTNDTKDMTISDTNQDNGQGKGVAIASMVLGIVSVVTWFFGVGAVIGLVTGIIGLICASRAKKVGYEGGIRTSGFVCSIIGLVGSALVLLACVACVGIIGAGASTASILDEDNKNVVEEVVDEVADEITANEDNNKNSDPEVREILDAYESFVDDYVDFMKKYKDDPTNLNLLSEYTDMLSDYSDFTTKIGNLDYSQMSAEDAQYYLDVTNRCTKKLLEVTE